MSPAAEQSGRLWTLAVRIGCLQLEIDRLLDDMKGERGMSDLRTELRGMKVTLGHERVALETKAAKGVDGGLA